MILDGKPLFKYPIDVALGCEFFTEIVVSTNDKEILGESGYPEKVNFLERPQAISNERSTAYEYVQHCLGFYKEDGKEFDAFCILQATTPFLNSEDVNKCFQLFKSSDCITVVTVKRIDQMTHPKKLKRMKGHRLESYFGSKEEKFNMQEIESAYSRNGGVYMSKVEVLQTGQVIGDPCMGVEMPEERSVDINNEFDFRFAEFLAKENLGSLK